MKFFRLRLFTSLVSWERSQVGLLRSWPVILRGGRRLCSTWLWSWTMLEKSAWSACPQSSDRGAWDLGKKPNLTALFSTDCNCCLSEASVNPHQRSDAYSILLISVAWVTSHRALPLSPFRSQDPKGEERLGTPADQAVNVGFEWEMILNNYTQYHNLVYPLYTRNRWRWQVGIPWFGFANDNFCGFFGV